MVKIFLPPFGCDFVRPPYVVIDSNYFRWHYLFTFGNIIDYICFWRFNSIIMTWNKWLVFTKSVIMGLNNLSPWPCPLCIVCLPCVITWLYSTTLFFMRAVGVVYGMSLASHGERHWFETHTILCSISYILLLSLFWAFWSLFPTMANISIFLSHWHSHINFYFPCS